MTDLRQPEAHPSAAQLRAFDRGALDAAVWHAVESHLESCARCGETLAELPAQTFAEAVRELQNEPGADSTPAPSSVPDTPACSSATDIVAPAALLEHPRYRLLRPIGVGGMGQVFAAQHRLMERVVALKVLRPELVARPAAVERFRQEVRAAARLSHPNIAIAYDADQAGDVHFLVMEFVEGQTLDQLIRRRGRLDVREACGLIQQACSGLQHAHERGMVHRDLKPANLMLTPEGSIKILDFGLARFVSEQPAEVVTPSETLVGTPAYLAPEQARAPKEATIQADIYSLGCTLYHLLAGRPPFAHGTLVQNLLSHQDQTPRPVSALRSDLPAGLDAVLERMLAKDPRQRYPTPAAAAAALAPFADGGTAFLCRPRASPAKKKLWVSGATALLLATMAVALWWPREGASQRVVEVAPRERPHAAELPAPTVPADMQARDWLKANCAFGPQHRLVAETADELAAKAPSGKAFQVWLGGKLVKSRSATLLAGRRNDFFAFEVSPGETPAMVEGNSKITLLTATQSQEFAPEPAVSLTALAIPAAGKLSGASEVRGTVSLKKTGTLAGKPALRITFMLGMTSYSYYYLLDAEDLAGPGPVRFAFSPLFRQGGHALGPTVLFLELCAWHDPRTNAKDMIVSNTVAALVYVVD